MILCWLQIRGFAVDEPFKISVHFHAPFSPFSYLLPSWLQTQ